MFKEAFPRVLKKISLVLPDCVQENFPSYAVNLCLYLHPTPLPSLAIERFHYREGQKKTVTAIIQVRRICKIGGLRKMIKIKISKNSPNQVVVFLKVSGSFAKKRTFFKKL